MHDHTIAWLGPLPSDWATTRGRFLFHARSLEPHPEDGVVTAFRDGQVTLRSNRRTEGYTFAIKEVGYQRVLEGDLVIQSMDAFAGAIGVSESTGKCSPEYVVLTPQHDRIDNRYFAYALREMARQGYIFVICPSVRERAPRFRHEKFKDVWLPVPTLHQQAAIADFLDRKTAAIDALIEKKERLIALLEEKRQALITQAVTKGLDPNVPMKDSGIEWLGDIPAHWDVKRIRHLVRRIEQGWSPSCDSRLAAPGEWGVLKAGCTANGVFRAAEHKKLPSGLAPRPELEVQEGDLLMSRASGSPQIVGSAAIARSTPQRLMLSDKVFRLHLRPDFDAEFVAVSLASRPAREQIVLSISGADGLANNLPQSKLREVAIAVPPLPEQRRLAQRIAAELAREESLATQLRRSCELALEYRQAVITAAVTGKLDVTAEEAA